jgi:hypothetical protein
LVLAAPVFVLALSEPQALSRPLLPSSREPPIPPSSVRRVKALADTDSPLSTNRLGVGRYG